jgi:serine protease Do
MTQERTPENQHRDEVSGHRFAHDRRNLAASAAAVAIAAVIGATAVFAGNSLTPTSQAHVTPVAAITPSEQGQSMPSFADLVERVKPAVVSVYVKSEEKNVAAPWTNPQFQKQFGQNSPFEFFFKQFGSPNGQWQSQAQPKIVHAQGSGFFISADGYLLTNNHVVNHATSVEIKTMDGKKYHAKVAGVDPKTDLALLKVESGHDFPYVQFASTPPRIGDWVVAMGNPFGLGGTVTAGIVSARGRDIGAGPYDDFLQIDAPVNSGNSGGPTFNLKGEVVGVNTAIFTPSGGSVGIAFDIPAQTAKSIAEKLKDNGKVVRGWIGVTIQRVSPDIADSLGLKEAKGALVDEPQDGSPASKAGLKSRDVILAVDGRSIKDGRDLARVIANEKPGQNISVRIMRDGKERNVDMTVGTYPSDEKLASNSEYGDNNAKLGLTLAPADQVAGAGESGAVVVGVDPNSAAAEKGIVQGDVILEAGGKRISGPQDVKEALREAQNDKKSAILMHLKTAQGKRFVAVPIG